MCNGFFLPKILEIMIEKIREQLKPYNARLVAVSKTKPIEQLLEIYDTGQRIFGENYVQEIVEKQPVLPSDIEWHFIGHLQSNKVKYIAPFVHTIHAVDSLKLLQEIDKQALKNIRKINVLLQFHIADEETKFGFDAPIFEKSDFEALKNVQICGVMGMATFTNDTVQVRSEFQKLKHIFDTLKSHYFAENPEFKEISMGMSDDYLIALEEGATLIRIGSLIFGKRNYA